MVWPPEQHTAARAWACAKPHRNGSPATSVSLAPDRRQGDLRVGSHQAGYCASHTTPARPSEPPGLQAATDCTGSWRQSRVPTLSSHRPLCLPRAARSTGPFSQALLLPSVSDDLLQAGREPTWVGTCMGTHPPLRHPGLGESMGAPPRSQALHVLSVECHQAQGRCKKTEPKGSLSSLPGHSTFPYSGLWTAVQPPSQNQSCQLQGGPLLRKPKVLARDRVHTQTSMSLPAGWGEPAVSL